MTTQWIKNKNEIVEGLQNNGLDITNTLDGTKLTIQSGLNIIKGPIMNSTDKNKLPPNVQHETVLYTSIREKIATPFVKSFMYNNVVDLSNNTIDLSNNNIKEGLTENNIINNVLNEDEELLKNSQNIANIIYFILLIPIIYISWFNWTYVLIPTDYSNIISFIDNIISKNDNDPALDIFRGQLNLAVGETKLNIGDIKINNWKLYEYIYYLTSELEDEEYKKYENIYGENSYSKIKNNSNNIHEPNYFIQCVKYFILPIKFLDYIFHKNYELFQSLFFDSYTLTSIIFLQFMFIFFLWGSLQSNFFSELTNQLISTDVNTILPFTINSDGSFTAGIGPENISVNLTNSINTISGNIGSGYYSDFLLSIFSLTIFLSFWFYIGYDFLNMIKEELKNPTIIGGILFILKWAFFISIISNFSFFIFIFSWFYLIIMTFFGYFFSRNSIKHTFFTDFFKNIYNNILQLDLYKYDLIEKLKNLRDTNNNEDDKSIKNIINNLSNYYFIQNNIIWIFKLTENKPIMWSIIIFLLLCFITILIEVFQIPNATISFFIINFIIIIILFIIFIIFYFGFNTLNNYFQYNENIKDKSNIFKNLFNKIISNNHTNNTNNS